MNALHHVLSVYKASSAYATKKLYAELEKHGVLGELAVNLMRASKKSERAKAYRGANYRGQSYAGKQWAMGEVARVLLQHPNLGYSWGWGTDEKQIYYSHVLYVDLPTGQVSFHSDVRGEGPEYPRKWDGMVGHTTQRICIYAANLLDNKYQQAAELSTTS